MAQNFVNSAFSALWPNKKQFADAERKFSTLQPEEHVSFFYQLLRKRKLLPVIRAKDTKSDAEAMILKKLGNEAFCNKDLISAVKLYSKSAAMASPNGSELAIVYANRSTALFRLESYTSCLKDIQRALDGNCDQNLKELLQERKLASMYQVTLKKVEKLRSADSECSLQEDLESASSDCSLQEDENVDSTKQKEIPTIPSEITKLENSGQSKGSSKLKINFSPKYGRHIIATHEIKPGETLFIETPYASVLSMDLAYTHCANCYFRCDSLVACPKCTSVMFCSASCQESAYNGFHRKECEIIRYARHFEIKDISWLAIRMLMVASNQGAEIETMMKHSIFGHPMKKSTEALPSDDSKNYANIHNLEDHIEKRSFDYPNGLTAALLLHILKQSSFFGSTKNNNGSDSTKKEEFVGTLLLKFLLVIECNALKIYETINTTNGASTTFIRKPMGWAIYSSHSYFNHSCEENATKDFCSDRIVTRAIQLIYPGQQVYINYYKSFNKCRREIREKYLFEQYYFRCTCRACEEDWPMFEDTGLVIPKLRENSISMETLKHYLSRSFLLRQKNTLLFDDQLVAALCHYIEIIQKSVRMPFKEFYECQEKLKQVSARQSNFYSDNQQTNSLTHLTCL